MAHTRSKKHSYLTLEYLSKEAENVAFDRKSAKTKASSLAADISAFANAEGGTLVIGMSDTKEFEGINSLSEVQLNDLIGAPKACCKPMPLYETEFLPIINKKGQEDRLLLLHIEPAHNYIIRTAKDDTYFRIGDRSTPMKGESLRLFEYQKQLERFEDTICPYATLNDLDASLIKKYKLRVKAKGLSTEQVLSSRGMIRDGKLTHAAVLLFAKNVRQFYPNCRVRFIRYDGDTALTGVSMNIIKDENFDAPILTLIEQVKSFVATQLRNFTALNPRSGRFETTPEYPEFAWQEAIINAITHREYALSGDYIRVIMYDDHLVIESPGKLPHPVTTKNIKTTRFSRNSTIARVLTEMEWVRELNEGVKRIYADMESLYLNPPDFKENNDSGTFRLVLNNNILVRHACLKEKTVQQTQIDSWDELDELEQAIVLYMGQIKKVKTADLAAHTKYSKKTIQIRLTRLTELGIVSGHGQPSAPQRYYSLTAYQ